MKMETKKMYTATGLVYGRNWGGGESAYPARKLTGSTLDEIIKQAKNGLDGSLDSGMGYERILGAVLEVECTESFTDENGRLWESDCESECITVGELTEEQQDFLADNLYSFE